MGFGTWTFSGQRFYDGRGGTIYDFAALLAGLGQSLRRAAFLTIQEELWREFYPEVFRA